MTLAVAVGIVIAIMNQEGWSELLDTRTPAAVLLDCLGNNWASFSIICRTEYLGLASQRYVYLHYITLADSGISNQQSANLRKGQHGYVTLGVY